MENNTRINQILEGSLKVFAQFGYKKASMEDIALELGMTKGNLYFYFRNKHDLYEKTVAHALLRWQNRVQTAVDQEEDIANKLFVLAMKSYEYLSEDEELRAIIIKDPAIQAITPAEERFPGIGQASYAMLSAILQQGVAEGKFRRIAVEPVAGFLYSIYCMFIIKTYVKSEGHSAQEMYRAGVEVVLKGLLNESRRSESE
jgi:AcrR family transcriptional regulator